MEWLFNFVILILQPTGAIVVDGAALVVESEAKCKEAEAIVKKRYEDKGALFMSCDPIKPGVFVDPKSRRKA